MLERPGYTAIDLRPLAGGEGTSAYSVSDTEFVVGESGSTPARWNREGDPSALAVLDGYSGGRACDVNKTGVIAGILHDGEQLRPVRWDPAGAVERLEMPADAVSGAVNRINDRGSMLGGVMEPGYRWHAIRWTPEGHLVELEPLTAGGETQAHDLNELDEVAGTAKDDSGVRTAVRWNRSGEISRLPSPRRATACCVNDQGVVAADGVSWNRDGQATLLAGGQAFRAGQTLRLTNDGATIGWGATTDGQQIGVRWDRSGEPTVLPPLPSDTSSTCFDIDDAGVVVGESAGGTTVRPVWWDEDATPRRLPSPAGLDAIVAQHVTMSGNIIIGYGYDPAEAVYRGIAWYRS
ncbi:hypothetical protein GCM10027598_77960 [Amycolatopsis oliviviridis]|uniref:Uncharacterized protein n=1 Tax=Amycolatopsis oliviviridis TaxID=1471590 RepID=A0ABQ3LDQ4_9PSEU|nr:hypothetical protein [Amycolatopsis oliviviridis]GHH04721.1 hypothetical protein GCM10017790_07900 [Amycolatopsis oliviviridis]